MTDTTDNAQDVPAATDPVLTETSKSKMAEDSVAYFRAEMEKNKEQAIARKLEVKRLQAELDGMKKQIEAANAERDKAVKEAEEIREAYQKFTDENELVRELESLRSDIKIRDLHDAFNGIEGVEYQDGVTLDDILQAAKLNPAEIDEITPEFVTKAIEAARTSKPFLFSSGSASDQTGEVRQEAAPAQTLKAFGAQAVGGGSAPPAAKADPAKAVDWSDHRAVDRYFAELNGK